MQVDREALIATFDSQRRYFDATLDLHLEEIGEGEATMRMPFREAVMNGGGNIHGGAIMSLCDSVFWVALATIYGPQQPTSTASLTCNFLRPATRPHDLLAHARVLKAGKRIVYGTVDVRGGEGKLIAHATANFMNEPIDEFRRRPHGDEATGHVRL
jgi:uncharacterized protein (TIGR00369 family)